MFLQGLALVWRGIIPVWRGVCRGILLSAMVSISHGGSGVHAAGVALCRSWWGHCLCLEGACVGSLSSTVSKVTRSWDDCMRRSWWGWSPGTT